MANCNDEISSERNNIINSPSFFDKRSSFIQGKDWRFYNVICTGFCFMLIFTAFNTCSMMEQSVLEGAKNESNGTFTGNGYTSLAVIYSVFSLANFAAPPLIAVIGPKWSMIFGGVLYTGFILSFLKPITWLLYLFSVLIGIGAAVIWTAQGNFITLNSDKSTLPRNSGISWAMLQCSMLFGNLYVYFKFAGEVIITSESRTAVFIVLGSTCGCGVFLMLFLCKPTVPSAQYDDDEDSTQPLHLNSIEEDREEIKRTPLEVFIHSIRLLFTKDMGLLGWTFAYTGLELTFFSGVYGTSVGHVKVFQDKGMGKSLIGLCGIFIGVGEILGGSIFGIFGSKTIKFGRDPIIMFGFIVHVTAFYLIFLILPDDAPLPIIESSLASYVTPTTYLVLICAFLMGLGDSCFNTQIYSLIGDLYAKDSAPAFALFKMMQSVFAAIGFYYSLYLRLKYQLSILVFFALIGSWTFFIVEWKSTNKGKEDPSHEYA